MILQNASELTATALLSSKAQATNNTASAGVDLQQYIGTVGVIVNLGVKTVGDNDGTVTVQLQDSATNNASNAANIASNSVTTSNNATACSILSVDTRAQNRYLFARVTLAGTNSPSYPVSVEVVGTKKTH